MGHTLDDQVTKDDLVEGYFGDLDCDGEKGFVVRSWSESVVGGVREKTHYPDCGNRVQNDWVWDDRDCD